MIEFTWDARKARRNEREHGISFWLARAALETGKGVAVNDEWREGEWRTNVVVPFPGTTFITITIASYSGDDHEDDFISAGKETEQAWPGDVEIRIISARESTTHETILYFEYRSPGLG
jgi:uncharacterized DUF497 family protein